MRRPNQAARGATKPNAPRQGGRASAVKPGERRDGQALIFGWGAHLTRAEKQKYRARFVVAGGIFVFAVIAIVIGVGALQQFYLKPRTAVAKVNGQSIERQWYDKNVAYQQFVLQHQLQDLQTQYQAVAANQRANAAATATANPSPAGTPAPSAGGSAEASVAPAPSPSSPAASAASSGGPAPSGSPSPTFTPTPTFNPQESATVAALTSQFSADQAQLSAVNQQTMDDLIDNDVMRQKAPQLGISVSSDDVSAQAKKTTDQVGGEPILKDLFQTAHLSQNDFTQIQYDIVLRQKFEGYFADHPEAAPTPSPTSVPSPTPAVTAAAGPQPPTPTPSPTPVPTPGADALQRWLQEQRATASITQVPLPLPSS
ncbi:MAG TPA: hypothetical protein VF157_14265 [Chloroflexota bacterium]